MPAAVPPRRPPRPPAPAAFEGGFDFRYSTNSRTGGPVLGAVSSLGLRLACGRADGEARRAGKEWKQAVDDLLARDTLVWDDTDKKGRPRQRDCRPALETFEIVAPIEGVAVNGEPVEGVRLEFFAQIDHQGRSLKPAQLKHWLSEALMQSLHLHNVRRLELRLVRC